MRNIAINLISAFLTGLLVGYSLIGTITIPLVLVCLASVAILAIGYTVIYLLKRKAN
ncbi:hypothetical protein QE450_003356 [Paenibacillus sp. SORGH_AS306]|nr:hypothetical protein [Paenibacillus sp. SORGH_AS_0306]MDR6112908.1 hypothetical protein [Paenibacillus sp. SORGH_AS_0338]